MLKKKARIRKNEEYRLVYQTGKSVAGEFLVVTVMNGKGKKTRFGIVVGTNFSKKAVVRNRLKRQLRAVAAKLTDQIVTGYDLVINIKKSIRDKEISSEEIEKDLMGILKKTKIIN